MVPCFNIFTVFMNLLLPSLWEKEKKKKNNKNKKKEDTFFYSWFKMYHKI